MDGYIALLERLLELQLVESVPSVQLTIRLLVPESSYPLQLAGFKKKLMAFDPWPLGYPRREVFAAIWRIAHEVAGRPRQSSREI